MQRLVKIKMETFRGNRHLHDPIFAEVLHHKLYSMPRIGNKFVTECIFGNEPAKRVFTIIGEGKNE